MGEGRRTILLVAVRYEHCVQKNTCIASKHPTKTSTTMYPALTILIPVSALLTVSLPSRAPPATVSPIPTMKRMRVTTRHCRICRLMFCSRAVLQSVRKIKIHDSFFLVIYNTNSHDSNKSQSGSDQRDHTSIEEDN